MTTYTHVATLVSNPQAAALDDLVLAQAKEVLQTAAPAQWLAPGIAADIAFTSGETNCGTISGKLGEAIAGHPVDLIVQPLEHRRKKLFLADMDSTIIGQECIDELADVIGMKAQVSEITERAMRGEIEFEPALRERVALLKGMRASIVDSVITERITLNPGARTLVQTLRKHGVHTMLVSGGFTLFTSQIAQRTGFHENRANELIVENGIFAGMVREPILGRQAKLDALIEKRNALGLQSPDTMAVGDGANDLSMLDEAGLGFAYHAKPAVAAAADVRIDHGDLTALLYAQGYSAAEFAT